MLSFEGKEKGRSGKEESLTDKVRKFFKDFLNRSDEPGEFLTEEKKKKIIVESKNNLEALREFEKDRNSKYRTNSLSVINWAEVFLLSDESRDVPADEKKELLQKIEDSRQRIRKEKELKSGFTKELVDEVTNIVNEGGKYIKQ